MFNTFLSSYNLLVGKLFSYFYDFPICVYNKSVSTCFFQYDAFIGCFYLMIALAVYSLVWSIIGDNCSKVDQIWSITPWLFSWAFYVHFHQGLSFTSTNHPRLLLLSVLMTLWGVRLTYNFWRRGGYGNLITHEEDYRWPIVRKIINNPWLFFVFNVTFIAGYQNLLLFLIALPAYAVMNDANTHIERADVALAALFLLLLAMETVADQQHFNFHSRKHALTKAQIQTHSDPDIREGFLQSGLFKYSRHPNYFAEQAMWVVVYAFSVSRATTVDSALTVYSVGCVLLILLFQGSMGLGESITLSKYPRYADYQRRTSQCIPLLPGPRSFTAVPMAAKEPAPVTASASRPSAQRRPSAKKVVPESPVPAATSKKATRRNSETPIAITSASKSLRSSARKRTTRSK